MKSNKPKKKDSKFVKKIKQHMYKWHRTLGIITTIPVIFWCLSGLMHPFMAHFFKPQIANEKLEQKPIDKNQLQFSIQEVLEKNGISEFKNFRIVTFDKTTYYQVKSSKDELLYFNTTNGNLLKNGDQKYAQWLSRYFLNDHNNAIENSELLTKFTSQYKYINRYLPVYKISYDRPDGMQVYVETSSSKLATYNPRSRQFFIWFFDTFHNWSFIDAISNNSLRIIVMILFLSIITFSALSGLLIYGLLWKQFKKSKSKVSGNSFRRYHRQIGIWVSLFTLTFAFSGAFHATRKWKPIILPKMVYEPIIKIKDIVIPNTKIGLDWNRLEDLSVIKMKSDFFYQCHFIEKEDENAFTKFINSTNGTCTDNTQIEYAQFLANKFSKMQNNGNINCCEIDAVKENLPLSQANLLESKILTQFDNREYGFANKRLPVVKLVYETPNKTSYYIETSTSRLAAIVNNSDRVEGYSFAFLHKFLFMDWAGKNIRDFTMVLAALSVLLVSILGLLLFLKKE